MSIQHSPADILRWLLVNAGQLADPTVVSGTPPLPTGNWPGYVAVEPNLPDNCVTLFDTDGTPDGRAMPTGLVYYHYGCQLRVRSTTQNAGYVEAKALQQYISESILMNTVVIAGNSYLVHCCSGIGEPVRIGQDRPNSGRFLHTLNLMIALAYTGLNA